MKITSNFLVLLFITVSTAIAVNCSPMTDYAFFSLQWMNIDCNEPDWCSFADINQDGTVGCDDFALLIENWPYHKLSEIVWISINKHGFTGEISKYETTNLQYVNYLNDAFAQGAIYVHANSCIYASSDTTYEFPYMSIYPNNTNSQIIFLNNKFLVRRRDEYDMSDHPVSCVTWYGAKAFCDYYGYQLPTEDQWESAADYENNCYACGNIIGPELANYGSNNPLGLTCTPHTTNVTFYPSYGYGMNDMAGNVWEWTDTSDTQGRRITKGGGWDGGYYNCSVIGNKEITATSSSSAVGFRVCRSLQIE
jgi:formylglycine-generating enzyme required for sulfatase activity